MGWQAEAERLKFDESKSWAQVADELKRYFPQLNHQQVVERVRAHCRRSPRYQQQDTHTYKSSVEYKQDGTVTSDKLIQICEGEELTPEILLKAHNMDVSKWDVVSYRNNRWHSQANGTRLIMYQSRVVVKPKANGLSLDEIDKHFAQLDRTHRPPMIRPVRQQGGMMAEINIADLHLGKLCWHGDTGENFDYKIARDVFYRIINEICGELSGKPLDYITFVWANDFFNSDTPGKTTTGLTPQDTDIRWQKLFNVGVEMLVNGLDMLAQLAPVKTFYTASNHDETTSYHALKYLEAWYRQDNRIEINQDAKARKYQLYGNMLLGYTHGDKERPRNLSMVMPNEARELWGQARYCEMHAAHLHSEHAIEEINGVIVRRISSPTGTDTWHYENGYIGAVRKAQTFLYDKTRGLTQIINTPV